MCVFPRPCPSVASGLCRLALIVSVAAGLLAHGGGQAALAQTGAPGHPATPAGNDPLALIAAVQAGDTDAVRSLLDRGADVNAKQPDGATALHWAVHRNDADTVARLVGAGADVNAANDLGATPLWMATLNGNPAIVERLLSAGADPNHALLKGETPLMTAARTGIADVVRLLIARGADVNAREHSRGQTALMWAVAQGHHDVVRLLIDQGADMEARSKVRPRLMFNETLNAGQWDQGVTEALGGFTPLLFAARYGRVESATLLLEAGANIDNPAPSGASPLVVAAHSGHGSTVATLLARGANPNTNGAGYTALHGAVLRGNVEMVEALLAHGADANAPLTRGTPVRRTSQDWALNPAFTGATPYWLAARFREAALMRRLAAAGADPLRPNDPLLEVVTERSGGVGPPRVIGGRETPLMAAVRGASDRGRFFQIDQRDPVREEQLALEAVRLAIDLGAEIDAVDEAGDTALHSAATRRLNTVIRLLAERGASLSVKNKRGQTPLALAEAADRRQTGRADAEAGEQQPTGALLRELGAVE